MDDIKSKVIKFVKKQVLFLLICFLFDVDVLRGTVDIGHLFKGAIEPTKEAEIDESETIRNSAFIRNKPIEEPIEQIEDDEVLKQLPDYYFNASPDFDIQYHLLKVG